MESCVLFSVVQLSIRTIMYFIYYILLLLISCIQEQFPVLRFEETSERDEAGVAVSVEIEQTNESISPNENH